MACRSGTLADDKMKAMIATDDGHNQVGFVKDRVWCDGFAGGREHKETAKHRADHRRWPLVLCAKLMRAQPDFWRPSTGGVGVGTVSRQVSPLP